MIKVSKRINQMPSSPMRALVPFAFAAKKKGIKIYHLNIGDPDIKTPDVMIDAIKNWNINPIKYGQSQGEPEFLESVKWYYHKIGFKFIDIENIQITSGGSEAISFAFFATCEPKDEVIVFEPFYANYNSYAITNDIKLVPITTQIKDGFHLPDKKEIIKHITKKTKAIFICNPNNPTGTVYSKEEIEMLVGIARKYKLFLLSDEVYREFAYDGRKQVSLLNYIEDMPEQIIILDSLSKRYSICGARLGMLVSKNMDIMAGVLRIAQSRLSSGYLDQLIAAKLTEVPQKYFDQVHKEYQKRRDILYAGLLKIPHVFVPKPEGAFYMIVSLPVDDAGKFCQWLLTDFQLNGETVMLAPAAGFYSSTSLTTDALKGKNEVRIAYVLNSEDLKKSLKILEKGLEKYNSK